MPNQDFSALLSAAPVAVDSATTGSATTAPNASPAAAGSDFSALLSAAPAQPSASPGMSPMDLALEQEGATGALADLARSVYHQESRSGRNTKTSNAGAQGGMQMIPSTFVSVADQGWNIKDPVHNARAGVRYLQQMLDQSGGDPRLAAAGYYGGPGGLEKARRGIAVADPRNPNAPTTLQYADQVASRLGKAGADFTTGSASPSPVEDVDGYSRLVDPPPPKTMAATAIDGFKGGFKSSQALGAQVGALILNSAGVQPELQKHLLEYAEGKNEDMKKLSGANSSFTDAIGPDGDLPRWIASSAGYLSYQVSEAILTGGLGAIVGKTIGKGAVTTLAKGMMEKEIGSIAASDAAKALSQEQIAALAAGRVATKVGAVTAEFANSLRQEGGSIYGDAVEQSGKTGQPVDVARVWAAAVAAGAVDTLATVTMAKGVLGLREGSTAATYAGRLAREVPKNMAVQGGTEAGQTVIEQYGAAKPFDAKDVIDSAAVGALGGVGGAAGVAMHARTADPLAGVKAKAAEPNSPLSRAASLGNPDSAAQAAAQVAQTAAQVAQAVDKDPILTQAIQIEEAARSNGTLDALRAEGSPVAVQAFIKDLATAKSTSTSPAQREQALSRLEFASGWVAQNPAVRPPANPDEISGFANEGSARSGSTSSATELRAGADRDAKLQADLSAAGTEFERAQILAQAETNRVTRMGYTPNDTPEPTPNLPGIQPGEQERLEAAALTGELAKRRAEDDPRQIVINRAMKSVEERGGVASPAEAQIFAEANLGKPYDRVDENLAPPLTTDQQLQQATGIILSNDRISEPNQAQAQANPAPAATNNIATPAYIRKRRATLNQLAGNGFETVAKENGQYVMLSSKNGQRFVLDGAADAQLARAAIAADLAGRASATNATPSEAQIAAGNYKKGRLKLNGLDINIENPRGSTRSGTDDDGNKWETTMTAHYGEFARSEGADGDAVDVFIGPRPDNNKVFVVDQINPATGKFDEVKVMMGYGSESEARAGYLSNYAPGWQGLGGMVEMPLDQFKTWLKSEQSKKPASDVVPMAVPVDPAVAVTGPTIDIQSDGQAVSLPRVDVSQLAEESASPERGTNKRKVTKAQARVLNAVAAIFGKQIQFFSDPDLSVKADGFVRPEDANTIYLNEKTGISPLAVFGHELLHLLKRDMPEAHAALMKVVAARMKDGGNAAFRKDYYQQAGNDSPLNANELEEITSDLGGNLLSDETFWRDVLDQIQKDNGTASKGIIARLVALLDGALQKLVASIKGPKFQADGMVNDLAGIRAAYKDALAGYIQQQGMTKAGMQAEVLKAGQAVKKSADRPQTETEAFKKWFGDSKVVDAKGQPLVVYHGTDRVIKVFDKNKGRKNVNHPATKAGFFFTENRTVANNYAVGADIKSYNSGDESGVQQIIPAYLSIKNPKVFEVKSADEGDNLLANADVAGYDGAIFRIRSDNGASADYYAAFDSTQIKSATDNNGNFDPQSKDITKSADRLPATGIHYSKNPRKTISGQYHGTGLKGLERERLQSSDDARLKSRLYFYIDEGKGVRPESGVGGIAHEVKLPKLYDAKANPDKLWKGGDLNATESAILDAGYDGYYVHDIGNGQGAAVVMGDASKSMAAKEIPNPARPYEYRAPGPETTAKSLMAREIQQIIIDNIPGAKMRAGILTVPAESYDAATQEMARIGSPVRFDGAQFSRDRKFSRVDPMEVSTRAPYAQPTKTFTPEDSTENLLISNFDAGRTQDKWLNAVTALVETYPNYRSAPGAKTADQKLERMITQMTNNLVWLHDQVPAETRQRSKLWYDGARVIADRMSKKYGITPAQSAGILAALSPQKDWFMNISLADRVASTMAERQQFLWSDPMEDTTDRIFGDAAYQDDVDQVRGQTLAELDSPYLQAMWLRIYDEAHNPRSFMIASPEGEMVAEARTLKGELAKPAWGGIATIAKAASIFRDGSAANISEQLGRKHKVRNFFNNILLPNSPNGHVTIDTHAVAAALLRPLSGNSLEVKHNFSGPSSAAAGLQGTYALYEEAYHRAASHLVLLPRELQSIAWEAIRGMYTPGFKSQSANVAEVDKIWTQFQKGRISYDTARTQALDASGGIDAPSWSGRDPGAYVGDESADDGGDVSGDELSGRSTADDGGADGRDSGRAQAQSAGRTDAEPVPDARGIRRSAERVAGEGGADQGTGREEDGSLTGLPRDFEVAGTKYSASHWAPAEKVARDYMAKAGLDYQPPTQFAKVDPARATRIAAAYEAMAHAPQDPDVKAAYAAMIAEVSAQYEAIVSDGLTVEFIDFAEQGDPYAASPRLATEDVRNNKHFWVFSTRDGFGSSDLDVSDNPMLAETAFQISGKPALANDIFRVVHDYFGHVKEGVGFRANGEENAWRAHVSMFSPLARRAVTTETRGQNSWVNYGPKADFNRTASGADTVYADQKVGLLPIWASEDGASDASADIKKSTSRTKDGQKFDIVERDDGIDAMVDGLRIGYLNDNLRRGQAQQIDEDASVDIVKVTADYKGQGVGAALYKAFADRHDGRITPSGKTSAEAWALWQRQFPEKVEAFVEREAERIADGASPALVLRNITDPAIARRVREQAAGTGVLFSMDRNEETVDDANKMLDNEKAQAKSADDAIKKAADDKALLIDLRKRLSILKSIKKCMG